MQNEELQREIEELRGEVKKLRLAMGRLNWRMWDFQRALSELDTMASKLVGQAEPDVIPEFFSKALLDIGVANEVDILYPADKIFQTKSQLADINIALESEELAFIPFSDELVSVTQEVLPALQRWDSFSFCWAIRLRELEITTRAIALIWRMETMPDPDIQIIKAFVSMCRSSYSSQATGAQSAWQRISRDQAELLRVPLECADNILEQLSTNGNPHIQLESEEAKELGCYLQELDLATTRALVLSGELFDTREIIDLNKVIDSTLEKLPDQIREVVKIERPVGFPEVQLEVPLFVFALRDIILTLWRYGNGKDGIFIEYGEDKDKVFFDLWSEGRGLPNAVKDEVLNGKVVFHPRGDFYGQGVLSLRACKRIIEELHSMDNHEGKFCEIGDENKMHFHIEI